MNCGTCANGTPWKHGFVQCKFMKAWEYLSERCACIFTPTVWIKRPTGDTGRE